MKLNFFFGDMMAQSRHFELEVKKYAQCQELLIFAVFLKNWPTVAGSQYSFKKNCNPIGVNVNLILHKFNKIMFFPLGK
jgi:hypothetical protein